MRSMTRVTALSEWTLRTGLHFPFKARPYWILPHWRQSFRATRLLRGLFFYREFPQSNPTLLWHSRDLIPHYFVQSVPLCPVSASRTLKVPTWRAGALSPCSF